MIEAIIARLDRVKETLPDIRREALEAAGDEMLAAVRGRIGGTGKVQKWQDRFMGSKGGYGRVQELREKEKETNLEAMMGEGYNRGRSEGMEKQIAWMDEQGEALGQAYSMIGQWKASLENLQEQYEREAMNAVMTGDTSGLFAESDQAARLQELAEEYQDALADYEAGNEEAGATMGRLLAEAQIIAQNEYNASEGAQLLLENEKALIGSVGEDTELKDAYYNAGYALGEEFSKGRAAGMVKDLAEAAAEADAAKPDATVHLTEEEVPNDVVRNALNIFNNYTASGGVTGAATGLERVPYNEFPAMLHEGERVLTAAEARTYNSGGGAAGGVTVTGNTFVVRQDSDIEAIAAQLLSKIREAGAAGVY